MADTSDKGTDAGTGRRARARAMTAWAIAVRPFAYTASVLPVVLGLAISHHAGFPVRWGLFALTMVGVISLHTSANLLNDCFDYRRGLDRDAGPGSGAVVRRLLTDRQVLRGAAAFLALGLVCLVWITRSTEWMALLLGLGGVLLALAYTAPQPNLKSVGLGDLTIFLAFGAPLVFGTYWVQARAFSWLPVYWGVPLGLLTVAILHANNWRDIATDRARGCRTLACRLGNRGSAAYYRFLVLTPFALVLLLYLVGFGRGPTLRSPVGVFLAYLALPVAFGLVQVGEDARTRAGRGPLAGLDGRTAKLQAAFGTLVAIGFLIGGHIPF